MNQLKDNSYLKLRKLRNDLINHVVKTQANDDKIWDIATEYEWDCHPDM